MARGPRATNRLRQSEEEQRLCRWICAVWDDETQRHVGSGILIDEDKVLTSAHVAPGLLDWDTSAKAMGRFKFLFDLYDDENGDREKPTTVWAREALPLKASKWADADIRKNAPPPEPDELDYTIVGLKPLRETNASIGRQLLKDGSERGWLILKDAGELDTTLNANLLGVPQNSVMKVSSAGKMVQVEGAENRHYYTTYSNHGMSGGLAYLLRDGTPIPVALHAGNADLVEDSQSGATVPAVHGIPLRAIHDHIEREGGLSDQAVRPALMQLKIQIVVDFKGDDHDNDEQEDAFLADLTELFDSEEVTRAFATKGFRSCINAVLAEGIEDGDVTNLAGSMNLGNLDKAAKADLVFIFASAKNCADLEQRDRLVSTYGYLTARLGHQRVYLVYPRRLGNIRNLQGSYLGSTASVLRYNDSICEIAKVFPHISTITRKDKEDERGFFELAQIALHTIEDKDVFERPYFGAKQTLDMLGLRFGNLAGKIPTIIDEFLKPEEDGKVTIAFPGLKVWEENPGWRRQLQGGGVDTINFLSSMVELSENSGHEASLLGRIRLIAITEIPTFIITAADIHSTWGKMLIAPAFTHRQESTASQRNKPRMLVYNKLSQAGIFSAYREALTALAPCCGGGDTQQSDDEISSWTLNDGGKLADYIKLLEKERAKPRNGEGA